MLITSKRWGTQSNKKTNAKKLETETKCWKDEEKNVTEADMFCGKVKSTPVAIIQ